jgi:hypothetical protein
MKHVQPAAFGPLPFYTSVRVHAERPRVAAGGIRRGLMLWRSALRADCTAMLGPRSRRRTRCVSCAHCAQTTAASQMTMRAARADRGPALLVATEIAPTGYRLPRVPPACFSTRKNIVPCKGAPAASPAGLFFDEESHRLGKGAGGWTAARLCAAEKRRACGPRAQRASSTDSSQLSERSERSSRSEFCDGAARPSIAGHPRAARASSEAPTAARPRLCSRGWSRANACPISCRERFMRRGSRKARWSH